MNAIDHKQLLLKKVQSWESQYNPEIRMLRVPFHSPGYHTALKNHDYVHATYPSLVYAVSLLDTELPEYEQRAFDIIESLVSLQDCDLNRDTFGIWSWFYEEPLDQMSPPDWNWADFCGKLLVLVATRHQQRLPDSLRQSVQQAIYNACDAIIKRNVGPHYTNISIMGAFVTLIAGDTYGRKDYADYGLQRLEKLYHYTKRLNTFQEYNSPNYAVIAILELSKIHMETKLDRAKELSAELLDLAWQMVAEHYHPATKQWSGPHSRCYKTLLTDEIKSFLQVATNGEVMLLPWEQVRYSAEWYKSGIQCPAQYFSLFLRSEEKTLKQVYSQNDASGLKKWATTYMTPEYSVGSFSDQIMWNQCRNLLAYMKNGGEATYIHFRCLHDGYDYSSAAFTGAQHREQVLFGIHFITNGGDTHPVLDKIDGTIEASDLRFRFEIGGCLDNVKCEANEDAVTMKISDLQARSNVLFAAFEEEGENECRMGWEIHNKDGICCVDYVIYSGEKRKIDFRSMCRAAFVFSFSLGPHHIFAADIRQEENRVIAKARVGDQELGISALLKPV